MNETRERIHKELDRIATRLTGLNVTRLESCASRVFDCAQQIADLTPGNHPPLPIVGVTAVGAQITVITRDYLSERNQTHDTLVADLLTQLRRDLP